MKRTECNCGPLYRTYQVTKTIIIVPPLTVCCFFTMGLHNIGTAICMPIEYVVNGNMRYTAGKRFDHREEYIARTFYDVGVYLIQ